ncbi:hypothetical protein FQZ97_896320 [compost metagenome]
MGGQAVQLGHQHTDIFNTFGKRTLYAQHLFYPHGIGVFRVHGGQVVQPVYIRNDLVKGHGFGMFFETAVQITQVRRHFTHQLAVSDQLQAEYTVGRRMLRTQVQDHLFFRQIFFFKFQRFGIC